MNPILHSLYVYEKFSVISHSNENQKSTLDTYCFTKQKTNCLESDTEYAELTTSCVKQKIMRATEKGREWKRNREKEKHIQFSRTLKTPRVLFSACWRVTWKSHPAGAPLHETREGKMEGESKGVRRRGRRERWGCGAWERGKWNLVRAAARVWVVKVSF